MKDVIVNWMGAKVRQRGVLAAVAAFSDRSAFSHSFSPSYLQSALDNLGNTLLDVVQLFGRQRIAARRVKWHFENAQILATTRHDGTMLALICVRNAANLDTLAVDRLLAEFEELS